jgi:anti-sigma regulatory factor (Ser/Thr protein kinase)
MSPDERRRDQIEELALPRDAQAPGVARHALAEWYGESLDKETLDAGKLLGSELVTNAVVHGAGRIRLRTELDEGRLMIEVMDQGSGFEYSIREVPFHQLHSRGLALVDEVSSRWGIHEGTAHVWAEVERTGPRLGTRKKPEGSSWIPRTIASG